MPGAHNRSFFALRVALLSTWLAGTVALAWLLLVFPNQKHDVPYKDVVLDADPTQDLERLTARLLAARVIDAPGPFTWYVRLLGADTRLRGGPLVVNRALSVRELMPRLVSDFGVSTVRVSMPEGFTSFDIAIRLERFGVCRREAFERAVRDPRLLKELSIDGPSAEGFLFPATYNLPQGAKPDVVVRQLVRTFRERVNDKLRAYEQARDGQSLALTTHQLVTLASIVEREARVPEERKTIAGVFMNRLTSPDFRPHKLQADPTVAYGCLVARDSVPTCANFDGRHVTAAMVRDPANPYSTYRIEGLPPGPICNPGLSALDAALSPEQHTYFYFVTHGGGRHFFTRTLDEHNERVHNPP